MSNSYIVELERLRVQLVGILQSKGKNVDSDATLQTLIPLVASIGINDEFKKLFEGDYVEVDDTEGNITSVISGIFTTTAKAKIRSLSLPECTILKQDSLSSFTGLTTLSIPKCTTIEEAALTGNTALTSITLSDNITTIGKAFLRGSAVKSVNFGTVGTIASTFLSGNSVVESVKFNAITTSITFSDGNNHTCYNATSLKVFDVGNCTALIQGYNTTSIFRNCTNFKAFVIRKTDAICTMNGTAIFSWLNSNVNDWYIYVPDDLVESYKSASNWSTYAARIKGLSEYDESSILS